MKNTFISICILLLLSQCKSTSSMPEAQVGQEFTIKQGQQVVLRDGQSQFLLLLEEVEDSRCPKGVQCIRYGNATVQLVVGDNKAKEPLRMCLGECDNTLKDTDQAQHTINHTTYQFELLSISPYPQADGEAPAKEARLLIKKR